MQIQAKVEKRRVHWFLLLIAEYSICNLGNFAVMAIFSLFLVQSLNLPAAQAGGLMLFSSLSFCFSRILLAPVIDHLPVRQAMFMALSLTGLGYLAMSVASAPLLIMLLLLVVGVGHGTNSLLVKTVAAQTRNADTPGESPLMRYASLTTGINVSAAVGSVLGSTLIVHWSSSSVFLVAAATYGISALIATQLPTTQVGESQRPQWGTALRLSLKLPSLWRAMLFTFLGWFLYAQSYASLPLFVSGGIHRPDLLGSLFALNAVLVVVGQLPLSKLVMHLRLPTSQMVVLAFLSFASGFALLWFFPAWQVVYAAILFWTLGEMLLMPALDTMVAQGALFEHKQVAFTVNSAAIGLGEGVGNLVGVAVAGWLLKYGDIRSLYILLTFVAIGAMAMTVLAGDRRESMLHRLLRGQPLRPTGQTGLLHPVQAAVEKGGITQTLLTWLGTPSFHEERSFLETHPELLALETGQLNAFMATHPEQEAQLLSYRLNMLREVQSRTKAQIRAAYINMHGGLVLDLPPWLEAIKSQLSNLSKEGRPDQMALKRMILLHGAIKRARTTSSLVPEILAELQVLYAIARLETPLPERAQAIEVAIPLCEEALKVYTLAHYPYLYARAQIFLSLAYQGRVKGERRENLVRAIMYYKAALQAYASDPFPIQLVAQNHIYARYMVEERRVALQHAIAQCQRTLQHYESAAREWAAGQSTQLLATITSTDGAGDEITQQIPKVGRSSAGRKATHVEWIAAQLTQQLS